MKQLLVAGAALFAISAVAQTSAPQATTTSTENQTSTTAESTVQAAKKVIPSLEIIGERSWIDPTDTQATDLDMTFKGKVGFNLNNGNKITISEKFFYSHALNPDKQYLMSFFDYMKIDYSIPNKIGSGGSTALRLSIPVTQATADANYLATLAVLPNLAWDLTPKLNLSYSGYAGLTMYGGNRKNAPDWLQDLMKDGAASQAYYNGQMNSTGAQRSYVYVTNTANVAYSFSDKISLSQSLGYAFGLKDLSDNAANFKKRTGSFQIGTSLDIQATKDVGVSVGISQEAADMPGAANLSTGKSIFFDNYNFALYREEQSTFSVSTSIVF